MKKGGKSFVTSLFCLVLLQLAGCASNGASFLNEQKNAEGKPQWVVQGTTTLKSNGTRAFLAVGTAQTQGALSTQASIANQRAKIQAELILSRFFEVVSRDYIATGTAESAGYTVQDAPQSINEITAAILPYLQIMEHWHDADNNKIYAVTGIGLPHAIEKLDSVNFINPSFKAYIKSQGVQIFDRIATQR